MSTGTPITDEIDYPDSDGEPMADNTLQWDWMVKIVSELRVQYAGQNVFVAGDLLWYPIKGNNKTRIAPDGLVVFGRPPGYRGSYQQWKEDGIAPHVVFEVLSPKNTLEEMIAKQDFYDRFGVEEFYIIDPYEETVECHVRVDGKLVFVPHKDSFVSPRLGIKFLKTREGLIILTPDGREFQTREEQVGQLNDEIEQRRVENETLQALLESETQRAEAATQRAEAAALRADAQTQRAEAASFRAEVEAQRAEAERMAKEKFMAKLRELGVNPGDLLGGP